MMERCDICNKERSADKLDATVFGVRYCNDNPDCRLKMPIIDVVAHVQGADPAQLRQEMRPHEHPLRKRKDDK
jgi:hypothetical protein